MFASMPVAFLPIYRMGMRYSGTDRRKTPAGYLLRTSNTKLARCDCQTEASLVGLVVVVCVFVLYYFAVGKCVSCSKC